MKISNFILPFIFIIAFNSTAQTLHFRTFQLPNEHAKKTINVIHQTSDHFIWLGTSQGLIRFDGNEYDYFIQDSSANNHITSLYEDKNGMLWVGYKSGKIGKFNRQGFIPYSPEEGFPKESITGFAEDSEDNLWFSTYGEGAYVIKNNRIYNINKDDGLADDYIYSIIADHKGEIWLGSDRGIAICNYRDSKKNIRVLNASGMLPDNIVTSLSRDSTGLWIGMESKGVCRYNFKTDSIDFTTSNWPYGRVTTLAVMEDKVWTGTRKNGIISIDKNTWNYNQAGAPENNISQIISLMNDEEGNLWTSTGTSSFHVTSPVFTFISKVGETEIKNVQAILRTDNGHLWYSTESGLYFLKPTNNGYEKGQLKLKNLKPIVISMCEDQEERIWFGTFDHGVFLYDPKTGEIQQLTEKDGLVNNNVLSIACRENELWFATLGGVSRYSILTPSFKNYTSQSGLGSNYVYQAYSDLKGRLWFATDGHGITMLDAEGLKNFSSDEGLTSNVIYSITEDANGNIWAGSSNMGLYKYEDGRFKEYKTANELRDLAITSLIGDEKGNILIVSNSGIDILNPDNGIIYYNSEEAGINDINPNLNSYSIDREGHIWLGGQSSIIKYTPQKLEPYPKTSINEMQVFLKPYTGDSSKLSHDENHISFEYSGFWFRDPDKITYLIKLEGYDREWTQSRNDFITYPNLPPGDYTFKLRSSVTGNFGEGIEKSYGFTIAQPFYNTFWFYLLIISFIGFLMFIFVKNRERKLKVKERQKKEQAEFQFETLKSQVNPHFLFNSFNTLIAVIEEDQDTAVEYAEKLSDFYRKILEYREKNVIPLKEELEMIYDYHFLQSKRYKDNFKLSIDVKEDDKSSYIPPMTLQLLVENAVKHNIISKEKPLLISISSEDGYLVIKNNLQIRHLQEPSTKMGLENIISRFKLLTDKNVQIDKNATHFIVKIPLISKRYESIDH